MRMASKTSLNELAQGFSLLSDATRLSILLALMKGPKNVTTLCKAISKRQPLMSHHLGLLRMARLVEGTRKGKEVIYQTNAPALKALLVCVKGLAKKK